jgi:hypothetical protein
LNQQHLSLNFLNVQIKKGEGSKMAMFNKNFVSRKPKTQGFPKRSDAIPIKKISREVLNEATAEYFENGGTITKITDKAIMDRDLSKINLWAVDESFDFLNGDF